MKRIAFLTSMIFVLGLALPIQSFAEKRALLIGINQYKYNSEFTTDARPDGLTLKGCVNDVQKVREILINNAGFTAGEIKILTDLSATKAAILDAFDSWLIDGTRPGDVVLFYYSGHGSRVPDRNGDEEDRYDEAICPTDIRLRSIANMIIDDEIGERIERLKGRTVVVFYDSCHSGTAIRNISGIDKDVVIGRDYSARYLPYSLFDPDTTRSSKDPWDEVEVDGGHFPEDTIIDRNINSYTVFISACKPEETSLELPFKSGHGGIFTFMLDLGMKNRNADLNKDGRVTFGELQQFSNKGIDYVFRENEIKHNQHPILYGSEALRNRDFKDIFYPKPEEEAEEFTDHSGGKKFSVSLWVSEKGKNTFRVGETLEFNVKSEKSGYLYLFDVQDGSEVVLLFPNKYSGGNGITAAKTLTVPGTEPFTIPAMSPGRDVVLAIVTTKPYADAESLIKPSLDDLKILSTGDKRDLTGMLWDLNSRALGVRPTGEAPGFEWSHDKLEIRVVK